MSYANDDLTPLLTKAPAPGVGFRQGVVLSWNQETAENTVEVAGATLTDLPILNTNEALLLEPGAVVGILTAGPTWFILGRVTVPNTPAAASALGMVSDRILVDQKFGTVPTSSTTYQALSGPVVPDVLIGNSGKALLLFGASLNYGTATSANTEGGQVGVAVSGATTRPAVGGVHDFLNLNINSTVQGQVMQVQLLQGLNPGLHTFTHQIAAFTSGQPCNFDNRTLVVFAL